MVLRLLIYGLSLVTHGNEKMQMAHIPDMLAAGVEPEPDSGSWLDACPNEKGAGLDAGV